jgi:hypothetical protein
MEEGGDLFVSLMFGGIGFIQLTSVGKMVVGSRFGVSDADLR